MGDSQRDLQTEEHPRSASSWAPDRQSAWILLLTLMVMHGIAFLGLGQGGDPPAELASGG